MPSLTATPVRPEGRPGIVLSPKCSTLRKGFAGAYCYAPVRSARGTTYHETPKKNQYSHPHDALQYLLLGGGEADVVMNKMARQQRSHTGPRIAHGVDYNPLDYGERAPQRDQVSFGSGPHSARARAFASRGPRIARDVDYGPFN